MVSTSERGQGGPPPLTLKRVREEVVETLAPEGLRDGGHLFLSCSNCSALLVDVWCSRPDERDHWKVRAGNCPWCERDPSTAPLGGSFTHNTIGGFHYGGFYLTNPEDEEAMIPSTHISDVQTLNGVVTFTVIKGKADAKPAYRR